MPFKNFLENLKNFDWVLFGAAFLLICFSLAALYSVAISYDEPNFSNFNKQLGFTLVGIVAIFIISFLDYRLWQDYSLVVYIAVGLLLLGVLFFGVTIRGTTGWFSFFGFNFQPVELAKVALIAFLAWFLGKQTRSTKELNLF